MAKHLAEYFVNLCRLRLTSQTLAKLGFDHAESGFNITPLVIVGQEFFPLVVVIEEHL